LNFECKYVFVSPPSVEELKHRLSAKGIDLESPDVKGRIDEAVEEMEYGTKENTFHAVVVNSDIMATVEEIEKLLASWNA
jgi:guanylate kinase